LRARTAEKKKDQSRVTGEAGVREVRGTESSENFHGARGNRKRGKVRLPQKTKREERKELGHNCRINAK